MNIALQFVAMAVSYLILNIALDSRQGVLVVFVMVNAIFLLTMILFYRRVR